MDAVTNQGGSPLTLSGKPAGPVPRDPSEATLPLGVPDAVKATARGEAPSPEAERTVIDWLLAPQAPIKYEVPVDFDTEVGPRKLIFVIRSMDSMVIDQIERRNVDASTGRSEDLLINAQLVTEALIEFRSEDGAHRVDIRSPEFLRGIPDPAIALEQHFHWQAGLLAGVAMEVRRVSGWAPDRVGTARRALVDMGKSVSGSAG